MTTTTVENVNTLGDWAALGIQKHLEKILQHEPEVLLDKDPEELHQIRVGMRRLRSAVVGFAPVLDLPPTAQNKRIGQVARCLGQLRDLDVLLEALHQRYYPNLPEKEQKTLKQVFSNLSTQRQQAFKLVKKTLEGKKYRQLKQELQQWLDSPRYTKIEQLPIEEVLPDLLLPDISRLFLHPGWQVGLEPLQIDDSDLTPESTLNGSTPPSSKTVELILQAEGEKLHDLRKRVKGVRYQMNLFSDFYGATYAAYLQDMKDIQECLGDIQDSEVLEAVMTRILKSNIESVLPSFAHVLTESRFEAWKKWQLFQRRYLNTELRLNFRSTLLHPIIN
ncbi:MAG: CHAD domain-containing protein [Cyanobacteriota bacterium]|nr:CHAD domain-containing protein [Cyanobacteriota bacterium]